MCFEESHQGYESQCHLGFVYPKHTDPHLDQFHCLDEVNWIRSYTSIQDA